MLYLDLPTGACHGTSECLPVWWGSSPYAAEISKFLCHRNHLDNTCRLRILDPLKEQINELHEFIDLKKSYNPLSLAQLYQSSEDMFKSFQDTLFTVILTFPCKRTQNMLIRKVVKILLHVCSWKEIKVYIREMTAPNKCKGLSHPSSCLLCWFLKVSMIYDDYACILTPNTALTGKNWGAEPCFLSCLLVLVPCSSFNVLPFNCTDDDIGIHQYCDKKEPGKI